ncbi:hypothetical protein CHUAL_012157 [Chamberlinius hualienensis]
MDTTNSNQIRPIYSIETTGGFSHTSDSITNEPDIVRQNTLYISIPTPKPKDPVNEDCCYIDPCDAESWNCYFGIITIIAVLIVVAIYN